MSWNEGSTTVITGTLGGGKSLCAVDMGMDRVSLGGTVITNIPVDPYRDKWEKWMRDEHGKVMDHERLIQLKQDSMEGFERFAKRGSRWPVMLILDEAALDLNARDFKRRTDSELNFVVLARKLTIDLVFIAQDASDIDKQIRKKMQKEIHCRSLKDLWEEVKLPLFVRVPYTIQINGKPWRRKASVHWKAQSWGYFDTKALHGKKAKEFEALDTAKDSDLENVVKNTTPYYATAALAALVAGITATL